MTLKKSNKGDNSFVQLFKGGVDLIKFKIIALALMLSFIVTISGVIPAVADETLVTPDKLIVFKIGDSNYYTQEIGSDVVDKAIMDTVPVIKHDRTFVPVRFLGNALGVNDDNIKWDSNTMTATLKGKNELKLTIGKKAIIVNDQESEIDVAPEIADPGRTMLPARFVAEGLGFKVDWDSQNRLVIVYPEGTEKPDMQQILEEIKKPNPTKPGQLVIQDPKLKVMYKWFEDKGYKVGLPTYPNCTNNYGTIRVYCNRNASNKEQFDKDVYDQAVGYLGNEAGEWVKKHLDICEEEDTPVWSQIKIYGKKSLTVFMDRDGEIIVKFDGCRLN